MYRVTYTTPDGTVQTVTLRWFHAYVEPTGALHGITADGTFMDVPIDGTVPLTVKGPLDYQHQESEPVIQERDYPPVPPPAPCWWCDGRGSTDDHPICPECGGSGLIGDRP